MILDHSDLEGEYGYVTEIDRRYRMISRRLFRGEHLAFKMDFTICTSLFTSLDYPLHIIARAREQSVNSPPGKETERESENTYGFVRDRKGGIAHGIYVYLQALFAEPE